MQTIYSRRRSGERGQIIPLIVLCLLVLLGLAGTTVDLGHTFVTKRSGQNAVDSASLAGANVLSYVNPGAVLNHAPTITNSAIVAVHDFVQANGYPTVYTTSTPCYLTDPGTGNPYNGQGSENLRVVFLDSSFTGSCSGITTEPTSGFTNEVTVNIPPVQVAGASIPSICQSSQQPYNCLQVVLHTRVSNYIMGALGFSSTTVLAVATAYANPSSSSSSSGGGVSLPSANAAYLYEPAEAACTTGQCFKHDWSAGSGNSAPSKSNLTCTNCPTFFVPNSNQQFMIEGVDGYNVPPCCPDYAALDSNGDGFNNENQVLTFCDPWNGATCNSGQAVGTDGYSFNGTFYCSGIQAGTANGCTTSLPANPTMGKIAGNKVAFSSTSWTPPTPTAPTNYCGGLVLNGQPILGTAISGSYSINSPAAFFQTNGTAVPAASLPASCLPDPSEPFTIQPGKYDYIVINHGQYDFEGGLYWITGTAPQNTNTNPCSGHNPCGLTDTGANGIDHSNEKTGANNDWDLCSSPQNNFASYPSGCNTASPPTAGVWIGHGSSKAFASISATGTTCSNGTVASGHSGGGGDNTTITGGAVSFYFDTGSSGLVVTSQPQSVTLSAPSEGTLTDVGGTPMLINMQNSGWSHLGGAKSAFSGLVYQTSSATAGGVDIDGGAGSSTTQKATLVGQVVAYSLAIFGAHSGTAIDFHSWYNQGASSGGSVTGHNQENSLIASTTLAAGATPGTETFTINYSDEWMMDMWDTFVKINSLSDDFFSSPLWVAPYNSGTITSQPPQNGWTPSDANPRYVTSSQASAHGCSTSSCYYVPPAAVYTAGAGTNEYSWSNSTPSSTWDVSGDWAWGNQSNITSASGGSYTATISYTIPIPSGKSVNIEVFTIDGDHCGDYYDATTAFNNIGQPGGGSVVSSSSNSLLVQ